MFASIENPDNTPTATALATAADATPPAAESAAAPSEETLEEAGWGSWSLMSAVSKATYKIGDVAAGVTAYAKETAVSVASSAAETSTGAYVTETLSGVKAKVAEKIDQVDVESIKTKAKESYADFRQDPKASTIAAAAVAKSAVAQTASVAAGAAVQAGGRAYESAKDIAENSQTVAAVASVGGRALEGASRRLETIGNSETCAGPTLVGSLPSHCRYMRYTGRYRSTHWPALVGSHMSPRPPRERAASFVPLATTAAPELARSRATHHMTVTYRRLRERYRLALGFETRRYKTRYMTVT